MSGRLLDDNVHGHMSKPHDSQLTEHDFISKYRWEGGRNNYLDTK